MQQEILNIKSIVEQLLLTDERCKSNDKWLYFQALKEINIDLGVSYEDTLNMICSESVRRLRQKFQEMDKKRLAKDPTAKPIFLPASWDPDQVERKEIAQDQMHDVMTNKREWSLEDYDIQ